MPAGSLRERLLEARQEQRDKREATMEQVKTGLEVEFGFKNVERDDSRNQFLVDVFGTIFIITVEEA